MNRTEAIENLVRMRHMHDQRVFGAINDEEDEALGMAIKALEGKDTNVPTNSALDHIHNVVAENERKRGYEQAKAKYDAKLEEIKSRFKDFYFNKGYDAGHKEGYERGKEDAAISARKLARQITADFDNVLSVADVLETLEALEAVAKGE